MNKAKLIDEIKSKIPRISKKDAGLVLDAAIEAIQEVLASGEKVTLVGFGTFEVRDRQAREGRSPATGERIVIPAARVVGFKVGADLKKKVAG